MTITRITCSFVSALTIAAATAVTAQDLPETMAWSSYDVGSAGYTEASAMADAFGREFNVRIRIRPSGTTIGRLQPLVGGDAEVGFLATGTFFASEGIEDFAKPAWGPQDLRVIAGRPATTGMVTTAESGIQTVEDVKGHRLALTAGNASINVKCAAILAFADLSLDDVEVVMFPTYSAAQSSLTRGQADVTCGTSTSAAMYELESSPRGIKWLPIPASNTEGWDTLTRVAPFFAPQLEASGAGLSTENPVETVGLRYPVIVVMADASDEMVYAFIKAMDETFDLYKDATTVTERWNLAEAGTSPIDAPFHPAAIRYLIEKGIWTDEDQAWNDIRLNRLNALRTAWDTYKEENGTLNEDAYVSGWLTTRDEVLAGL
jgi:TRAP transporter TAXI family solute receptor